MDKFEKTAITEEEREMISNQLHFIAQVTEINLKKGFRTVISGGYAVDGHLGEITRPHNDIDIQIYGKDVMTKALLEAICLDSLPSQHGKLDIEDRGRKEYYHQFFINGIGAEVYYLQVVTKPFSDTKIMVRSDGTYSDEHEYDTKMVYLNGVRFEAQSAVIELADKIFKREHRGDAKQAKHEQDIYNLKLITDVYVIQDELEKMKRNYTHS